ncbi:hypothetical protein K2173_001642 [Erythroxylum novogranatense]|uniref:Olee1-like protein n=1 Tax=Erythroxylum novogranatense TaxID=1862640 RepID=A0AAV8T5K3_9ROSI|nr:hypothetical protein K2173_001642 [Erythroxylum novogranatense]
MEKLAKKITFLVSVLCFLSLLSSTYGHTDRFMVEGKVYCDNCRTQFITRISQFMKGAKVRLECKEMEGGSLTFSEEAETNESGTYIIEVDGDHEDDLCEIIPVKSGDPNCSEISNDDYLKKAARISVTSNNGIISGVRQANPLGFMTKEAKPECKEVLRELGFSATGLVNN